MTQEMGKRVSEGLAEIDKCALVCRYYAQNAETLLQNEVVKTEAKNSYISFSPLGVVLAVMPWNFPFWQVFRAAAPAIMSGNSMLLKHASSVPGCALAIEDIFTQAGAPPGLFQSLLISGSETVPIIQNPLVRLVSLTGSEEAGASVAALGGANIKKVVLELGGSDPFIVMDDADIETAAATAATARLIVSGQSCIAAKRFIVHQSVVVQFTQLLKQHFEAKSIGDPSDPTSDVGPLSSESTLTAIHDQVVRSIKAGAQLVTGGQPDRPGFFYLPTI
jgi:succinate-semialdehyde dehydrogenase/glutarate-semialdehyde dehydrogenase